MRATKLFLASGTVIFVVFFYGAFSHAGDRVDVSGPAALGAFELFGAFASLYLLSKAQTGNTSVIDWVACAFAILIASLGFAGSSITLIALYLYFRGPRDHYMMAAGTVAAAVAVQAVWAPLIFAMISLPLLQIDAGVVGWLLGQFVPGASWGGTVVYTPSGYNVEITAPCASFHNLSLATLCWVTLTMLHRPYWVKGDFYVGLAAAFIQFGFNIGRLVFVCMSLPMYDFWHDGFGKHIFSAIATVCAIIFVHVSLVLRDRRDQQKAEIGAAAIF